jgi:hypothetical protein
VEASLPSKKKEIQIIEVCAALYLSAQFWLLQFLIYNQDITIWGKVSDEEYVILICFTKDTVSQYVKWAWFSVSVNHYLTYSDREF